MNQPSVERILGTMLLRISRAMAEAGKELQQVANDSSPPAAPSELPATSLQQVRNLVIAKVAVWQQLPVADFNRLNRARAAVEARWLCWYILRHATDLSTPQLGKIFGHHYDHTTVMYGIEKLDARIERDPQRYRWIVDVIKEAGRVYLVDTPPDSRT